MFANDKKLIDGSRTTPSFTRRSSRWQVRTRYFSSCSALSSEFCRWISTLTGTSRNWSARRTQRVTSFVVLGVDVRPPRPTISERPPHVLFITDSAVQAVRPSISINGRSLDYTITNAGTVVPQHIWYSGNPADVQRYTNVSLSMPVPFVRCDQVTLGLTLVKAVKSRGRGTLRLFDARNAAPIGNGHITCIRINASISPSVFARLVQRLYTEVRY